MLYSYVGIDLAWKSGAIVVLDQDWKIIQVEVPQFEKYNRKYVWNKFNNKLPLLKHWKTAIEKLPINDSLHQSVYYIELMSNNKLFNYIAGYISGVIAKLEDNSPFTKLELIEPNKWNRNLTKSNKREDIKKASLEHFKINEPTYYKMYQNHPNLSDIADSYCIAYFGIQNNLRKSIYGNSNKKTIGPNNRKNRKQKNYEKNESRTIRKVKTI